MPWCEVKKINWKDLQQVMIQGKEIKRLANIEWSIPQNEWQNDQNVQNMIKRKKESLNKVNLADLVKEKTTEAVANIKKQQEVQFENKRKLDKADLYQRLKHTEEDVMNQNALVVEEFYGVQNETTDLFQNRCQDVTEVVDKQNEAIVQTRKMAEHNTFQLPMKRASQWKKIQQARKCPKSWFKGRQRQSLQDSGEFTVEDNGDDKEVLIEKDH